LNLWRRQELIEDDEPQELLTWRLPEKTLSKACGNSLRMPFLMGNPFEYTSIEITDANGTRYGSLSAAEVVHHSEAPFLFLAAFTHLTQS
jgi:hypothetical protein